MSTSAPVDEVIGGAIFTLSLDGLDTVMFTDISGLSHRVMISNDPVGTATGGSADSRVIVTSPESLTLNMSHVVVSDMSLFTWMDETAAARGGLTTAKSGTLSLVTMQTMSAIKSWNLADVYITNLTLATMGANSSPSLTANITLLVGSCVPAS